MNSGNHIILYYPTKKYHVRGWILEGDEIIGQGNASSVFKVCRDMNCDYVMKIINKNQHAHIKREICFQNICSTYKLCKPVEDWWLSEDKGGVIIMPILEETLSDRLKKVEKIKDLHKKNKEKWNLVKKAIRLILRMHKLGISHNDSHVENMMFDKHGRLFFIDMGVTDFLFNHPSRDPVTPFMIDYNQLFYYRNRTINFMFRGFVSFIKTIIKENIEDGETTILEAEENIVKNLINLNYRDLNTLIKPFSFKKIK